MSTLEDRVAELQQWKSVEYAKLEGNKVEIKTNPLDIYWPQGGWLEDCGTSEGAQLTIKIDFDTPYNNEYFVRPPTLAISSTKPNGPYAFYQCVDDKAARKLKNRGHGYDGGMLCVGSYLGSKIFENAYKEHDPAALLSYVLTLVNQYKHGASFPNPEFEVRNPKVTW